MSSILKALKKLEGERTSRFSGDLNTDAQLLRNGSSFRFSSAGVIVMSLLMLGGGSGATYLLMKRSDVSKTEPAVVSTQQPPTVKVAGAKLENRPLLAPTPPPPVIEKKTTEPKASMPLNAAPKTRRMAEPVKAAQPASPPLLAPSPVKEFPLLRVNGIAFQNGAADSVAIVNGITVMTGSVIEDVTVEEVRKDRVIFKRNGNKIEIQLGQSNR